MVDNSASSSAFAVFCSLFAAAVFEAEHNDRAQQRSVFGKSQSNFWKELTRIELHLLTIIAVRVCQWKPIMIGYIFTRWAATA